MTTKISSLQRILDRVRIGRSCLWVVVTISSAACAPSSEPTHQTVEYYRNNPQAREAMVTECANDPGEFGKTPDCINARQAMAIEDIGTLEDLPPMGLLKDAEDKSGQISSSSDTSSPATVDGSAREPR